MSRHCENCDEVTDVTPIPASHDFDTEFTIDREATCTVDGEMSRHCKNCDEVTDVTPISAPHDFDTEFTVDLAPTVDSEGSRSRHCKNCDERCDVTSIPKLVPSSPEADFEYNITDGKVTVTKYTGTSPLMSIPSEIEGLPVVAISSFAFYGNTVIEEVYIPYTVEYIDTCAFSRCTALEKIDISIGALSIGDRAFSGCTALSYVVIPSSVEYIGADAFSDTAWVEALTGELVIVGGGVLMRLENEFSEDLIIPEGVVSVYSEYGYGICESYVDTVYLPKSFKYYDQYTLGIRAESFAVDSDNPYFTSDGGVLFNKDKTELLAFPSRRGGEYVIPEGTLKIGNGSFQNADLSQITVSYGVLEIGNSAFMFCDKIEKITVPLSVSKIGETAFSYSSALTTVIIEGNITKLDILTFMGCTALTEVLLPFSLDSVGYAAFDGCVALERVYFSGTKEQWEQIDIDGENTELDGAEILCIDSLGFSDVYMEPEESIALKYRVDASNIECFGCENLRAVFELDGQEYTVDNYEEKDGYYVFTFSEISPEKLGDTVIATLAYTIADRELYSSPIGYRASEYCYSALRDGTADLSLKKVLVNLLNYCSEAQDYTGHSTDRLINADLTTDEMLLAAQDNPVTSSIKNEKYLTVTSPEASFTSARLLLKDSAQLILFFKMSDISGAEIEISSSLGKWVIDSQSFLYDGVNYYVCCDALSVADVSEELYVTVYKGGTAVSNTLSYSVESYVYSIASTDEKTAPLLDALMRYGSSAKEYSRLG